MSNSDFARSDLIFIIVKTNRVCYNKTNTPKGTVVMNINSDHLIALRREIHTYPEVDFDLPRTVALVKKELDAITLLIRRPGDNSEQSNHSDADVENFEYDYVIENDGTLEELEQKAQDFLNLIFNEK